MNTSPEEPKPARTAAMESTPSSSSHAAVDAQASGKRKRSPVEPTTTRSAPSSSNQAAVDTQASRKRKPLPVEPTTARSAPSSSNQAAVDAQASIERQPIPVEPTTTVSASPSSTQAGVDVQTPAGCKYAVNGHCAIRSLTYYLGVLSSEEVHTEDRMYHANIFCDAVTTGPRFVCTFQVCCGNISLLSFAVERRFPMEVLEFLLTNTRFRQEDGCRIIDFVEHIGSLIVCLMYGYSGRCFNNSLLDDAKRSLRLLLRAGTQNAFARRIWHNNGQYRTWILSVLHAASVYVSPIPSEPGQPYITRVVPILALLHLVECFMEMFPDEDASFWSVVLQELWMHSRITRGTLRRVADMTLRLLDLGASTTFALPDRAKGGSFLACLENGLEAVEDVNPYVDDIEATIGGTKIMEFGGPGQAIDIIRNRMYGKRIESIERLKKKILGDGSLSPPSVD